MFPYTYYQVDVVRIDFLARFFSLPSNYFFNAFSLSRSFSLLEVENGSIEFDLSNAQVRS